MDQISFALRGGLGPISLPRFEGELRRAQGATPDEVEAYLQAALNIARSQGRSPSNCVLL
ncbi:hypothetical protein [Microvirga pakistanensis]|uniref:hypothetical protein n=1 Tax=Microvirga pakistanensis TaxID=1682650 RepID=UPI00106D9B60|nr:hypothetical protein [Microvirga pakistanensis]